MKTPITVMLVEDNREYREVIRLALDRDQHTELACEFSTAEIALRSLRDRAIQRPPDVILLDLRLPGMSGIDALPHFAQS
ncbi:MAG: response regulator, partial [Akkermansiaceae bacterium]